MKSHLLKIVPLLFGLFLVGVTFGSFANVAQAYWSTSCAGGYETQSYSCVTDSGTACFSTSFYWGGGCGYSAGTYPAGCYPYTCYGTCTRQVWNPNINCTSTWIPDTPTTATITVSPNPVPPNQTFSVTLSGGNNGTTYYNVNYGGNLLTNLPGGIYLGLVLGPGSYSLSVQACSDSTHCSGWISGGTLVVQSPPVAPTSAFISATPNPTMTTQSFHASWGATGATSYTVSFAGTSFDFGSTLFWDGTPASLGLGPNATGYPLSVTACNSTSPCATATSPNLVVTAPVPTITSFTAKDASGNIVTTLPADGGSVTLSWESLNTTSCTASGAWSGAKATSGNQTVSLTSTATYDLTCQ